VQRFYSVTEVARQFDVSGQTVRNWIEAGELLAIQPTRRGNFKIPAQALLVFKQRAGLLPAQELRFPETGPSRQYQTAEELYEDLIAPRLEAAGVASVTELLARAERDNALAGSARDLLPLYDLYLKELAASPALAATR